MNFLGYVHGLPNIFTKAIGPGYISESRAHTFGGGAEGIKEIFIHMENS